MGRDGGYSQNKRQREASQQRKAAEKAARRAAQREHGRAEPEIVSAESITGQLPSIEDAMRAIAEAPNERRQTASIPCRLFVGGLGTVVTENDLREAFGAYGEVADVVVLKDRNLGESRGFGFVTMASRKDAARAIDGLDGSELNGRRLAVNVATERSR